MKHQSTRKVTFWLLFALGFGWALFRLLNSHGWIQDDEPTHFLRSKSVWLNHDLFFDGWTRAGRNFFHIPVAWLGLTATRLYTLAFAALAVFLTAKSGQKLGIKSIWAIPALMFFQSWFPDICYSVLTQTPFLFFWILGIYLAQNKRYIGASLCFSYLSLIRHEGILLTGLWGLWVSCQPGGIIHTLISKQKSSTLLQAVRRDLILGFFTILPILLYNIANYLYDGSIPFAVYFESKPTTYYGSGPIYHYAMLLVPALGITSLTLALAGFYFIRKEIQKWSLILLTYVGYFFLHSFIFWKGAFASGGYYHFLMPMAPLFALLAAKTFDVIQEKFPHRGNAITYALTALVTYQGLLMIQQQASNWEEFRAGAEPLEITWINPTTHPKGARADLQEAAEYLKSIRKNELIVTNHAGYDDYFGYYATKELFARRHANIDDLPTGCYFLWDQKLSELTEHQQLQHFDQSPNWKRIKVWKNDPKVLKLHPNRIYSVIIFKKTGP